MTEGLWPLKTLLLMVSLSLMLGGWAALARDERPGHPAAPVEDRRRSGASREVTTSLSLPPIPPPVWVPLEGADGAAGLTEHPLALPPIPELRAQALRLTPPAVSAPSRPRRPIARTRSSR